MLPSFTSPALNSTLEITMRGDLVTAVCANTTAPSTRQPVIPTMAFLNINKLLSAHSQPAERLLIRLLSEHESLTEQAQSCQLDRAHGSQVTQIAQPLTRLC